MKSVDESNLNRIDRLGLAYCRLNNWEWDEILGPKPDGFDSLSREEKYERTRPAWDAILSIIGEANASRCSWVFNLEKSEGEWFRWYVSERFKLRRKKLDLPQIIAFVWWITVSLLLGFCLASVL